MNFPKKCIVDTNVPLTANWAVDSTPIPGDRIDCVMVCIEAIEHVVGTPNCLVLDAGDEIYNEYANKLSRSGQPGMGDMFMKWVHDNRWKLADANRVSITKNGDSYVEFPDRTDLVGFDRSDKKFVAVANKHPSHPPILQAVDRKWWLYKDALQKARIRVHFLCPEYAKTILIKNKNRNTQKKRRTR